MSSVSVVTGFAAELNYNERHENGNPHLRHTLQLFADLFRSQGPLGMHILGTPDTLPLSVNGGKPDGLSGVPAGVPKRDSCIAGVIRQLQPNSPYFPDGAFSRGIPMTERLLPSPDRFGSIIMLILFCAQAMWEQQPGCRTLKRSGYPSGPTEKGVKSYAKRIVPVAAGLQPAAI